MPVFPRQVEIKPEEIIGMKPEELKDKLDKAVTKTDLDSFRTDILQTVKDSLKTIEVKAAPPDKKEVKDDKEEKPLTSFIEDEDTAFDERFNKRISPIVTSTLALSANLATNILKDKPYYHDKGLKAKVDEALSKQTLANRANPAFVENLYKIIVSDHMDEIREGKIKTSAELESARNSNSNSNSNNNTIKDTLTEDEKLYCKRFNMTEEQYLKQKKEMKYV